MSVEATRSVWRFSENQGTARLVLLAIADNADDGGLAWPGHDLIADKCKVSRRAVIENLKTLEYSEELFIIHRRNLGNVYLIRLGDLPGLHELMHHDQKFKCRFCTNLEYPNVKLGVFLSADSRWAKCSNAYLNVKLSSHEPSLSTKETKENHQRKPLRSGAEKSKGKIAATCYYCGSPMKDEGDTLVCTDPDCNHMEVVKAS